jgi:hypothetical protein
MPSSTPRSAPSAPTLADIQAEVERFMLATQHDDPDLIHPMALESWDNESDADLHEAGLEAGANGASRRVDLDAAAVGLLKGLDEAEVRSGIQAWIEGWSEGREDRLAPVVRHCLELAKGDEDSPAFVDDLARHGLATTREPAPTALRFVVDKEALFPIPLGRLIDA